ncbi:MAG: hypothetical protein KGH58_00330, partial [Candidatus Micrarchaeota archaeon]|nr:hypothetical protein [Candidatus Micrarchaeota archaeon]
GRDAKFLIDYWQKKHPVASEIKGTVANKPVDAATGTVKIVLTIKDTEKVKPGDILVAAMTEPNFIHAMERASAFITDEGGILCHAAIVGREMNKPCIIGTGNATKVLKDGDTVSMDLNTGEVRLGALDSEAAGPSRSKRRARPQEQQPIPQESIETALDTALVVPFEHIRKEHIHIAGGKGANLGEMSQKFPIPSGFCVTVNAYKMYLKESGLEAKIHAMLKKLDVKDNKALDRTSAEIRKMILSHPIPSGVKAQILQGYTRLGGAYVAVRSSATAEDMPNASFAGQQDTYLNIRGEKALLDAVRSCWASLFTSRAIYYRELNKFEHEKVHISVVVQNMIEAEKSGIMFSVNPVTRDRNEMIIEGSFGLGEAIVSGMVTPDSYIIDKRTMKPKEIKINTKRIAIVRSSTGKNEKITLQEDRANARCLTDQELKRLAELATSIERHYGKPQDMEWAIADGQVYILQSRPITTL